MGRMLQRLSEVLKDRASCLEDVDKFSIGDISLAATDLLTQLAISWRSDIAEHADMRQLALVFINNFSESCERAYLDSKSFSAPYLDPNSCSAPSRASAEGSAKRPR